MARRLVALVFLALLVPLALVAQDSTATARGADSAAQMSGLWMAGLGIATAALTQLLKKIATPIGHGPDWLKAVVAGVVSIAATKLALLVHAPIPGDLHGVAATVVTWLAAMGVHAAAKKAGVVTDPSTATGVL